MRSGHRPDVRPRLVVLDGQRCERESIEAEIPHAVSVNFVVRNGCHLEADDAGRIGRYQYVGISEAR